jgi:hypothetical protein
MASDDDISVDRGAMQPPQPPQASDNAELDTVSDSANCAENYYKKEGSSLKLLVAMCHGLRDNGDDNNLVLDLTANPWKSLPVMQIRPSREFYANEVLRRCASMPAAASDDGGGGKKNKKKVGPRPKQWSLSKIQEWLEDHPILNSVDISFLKQEVASRKEVLEAARKEEEEDNARLVGAGNWNATACMRLIHALVDHDEIKAKFLNRLDLPAGRSAVENREQIRATNVWHLMANKWNDKNFEPETASMPEVHSEFALSDVILHIEVAHLTPATAEKVEDKWSSMILEMNRCIANWQKSGQGEGGINDADNVSDREFGSLSNRSSHALATRETYFKDRQLYLLYLWCMLDKYGLLGSALQKLNNSVSASNGAGGVPSVVRTVNKDAEDDGSASSSRSSTGNPTTMASLGKSIEKHGQSLVAAARMETQDRE